MCPCVQHLVPHVAHKSGAPRGPREQLNTESHVTPCQRCISMCPCLNIAFTVFACFLFHVIHVGPRCPLHVMSEKSSIASGKTIIKIGRLNGSCFTVRNPLSAQHLSCRSFGAANSPVVPRAGHSTRGQLSLFDDYSVPSSSPF